MYVNTTAEVKALTDYCCTSANAVEVVRHIYETHGQDTEILFGPDMWLGAYVEKELGRRMHVWDGECHVHAGIRPADIEATRAAHPGRRLPDPPRVRLLDERDGVRRRGRHRRGGRAHALDRRHAALRRRRRERAGGAREAVVATEVGMLYPLQMAAPEVQFIPANAEASCRFMKMITLPKLRDSLREMRFEVRVPREIADAGARADRPHGRDRLSRRSRPPSASVQLNSLGAACGPTQATASCRLMPAATSRTSSKVTASSAAIAASGSIVARRRRSPGWRRGARRRRCSRRRARAGRRRRRGRARPPPRWARRGAARRRSRACACRPRRTCPTPGPSRAAGSARRRRCGRPRRPSSRGRAARGSRRTGASPSSRRAASSRSSARRARAQLGDVDRRAGRSCAGATGWCRAPRRASAAQTRAPARRAAGSGSAGKRAKSSCSSPSSGRWSMLPARNAPPRRARPAALRGRRRSPRA